MRGREDMHWSILWWKQVSKTGVLLYRPNNFAVCFRISSLGKSPFPLVLALYLHVSAHLKPEEKCVLPACKAGYLKNCQCGDKACSGEDECEWAQIKKFHPFPSLPFESLERHFKMGARGNFFIWAMWMFLFLMFSGNNFNLLGIIKITWPYEEGVCQRKGDSEIENCPWYRKFQGFFCSNMC